MPVRHRGLGDELAPPQPKRCKHCDESRSSCGSGGDSEGSDGRESWRVTLDHDLVETLSAIYPEWFKPQHHRTRQLSPGSPHSEASMPTSDDTSSWGLESDMAGRQGGSGSGTSESASSPPRVSPPKVVVDDSPLQPAMGKHKESLKVKLMMRRPINQLVAQGIMPPLKTPPAYFEQCKQLERAKTGDLLKAKIQRRPDRQELERRHILEQESHVDPSLVEKQRMLKKARLADQLNDQLSHRPGPLELIQKNILHTEEDIETLVKSGTVPFKATCEGASGRPQHPHAYFGPPEEFSPSPSPPSTLSPASVASPSQHPAPGKDKNRKKIKHKQAPKARFKFHEYKGPPSAHKPASPPASDETPYELLLQQQQMLLQLMLPASPAPSSVSMTSEASDAPPPPPPPPPLAAALARFEDMKVSDLRAECKRRNLRVSGPKPQLLDRLRPFLVEKEEPPRSPASVASSEPDSEDIVQSQRRHIEELERKLEASRKQLEDLRRDAAGAAASDQSRRLLQAHLCVSQLRAQLDALQQPVAAPRLVLTDAAAPERLVRLFTVTPPVEQRERPRPVARPSPPAQQTYILNGVKVVPIAILPHYEAPPAPPPPPPPPMPAEDSQIMDDVLEILAENGELPAEPVHSQPIDAFAHDEPLSPRAELQRELDEIKNEIFNGAEPDAADNDLAVDLLGEDFQADFGPSDSTANDVDRDELFERLLAADVDEPVQALAPMDVTESQPERMCITPLPNGDNILENGRTGFDDIDDLSLPSLTEDVRHDGCDFDLKEFGIDVNDEMHVDGDNFGYMQRQLIPNLFGRGHVPQCDPLLGGVLAPAPRPALKHYSWDKIEFDAT